MKLNRTMFAIIIPYYKLTFFRETLDSLAAQTDQGFTVYIGDDASPEDPTDLLHEFEGKFNFTYKKFDNNLGGTSLTKQWERCIEMLQNEEWLMILGDDDLMGEKAVENFHQNIEEANQLSNVIRYATQVIDESSQAISDIFHQPKLENAIDSYFRKKDGENRSSLSEYVFRASQVRKHKFRNFPLAWCADDIAVLDFSAGKPIYSLNEELVYVRMSRLNISGKNDNHLRKVEALDQSFAVLMKEYFNQIPTDRKISYIKLYDHIILKAPKISFGDFLYLQYFTIRNIGFQMVVNQWKAIIHRLIFVK